MLYLLTGYRGFESLLLRSEIAHLQEKREAKRDGLYFFRSFDTTFDTNVIRTLVEAPAGSATAQRYYESAASMAAAV